MATVNLIKSAFTGRLGELTGATWKGKPVIKAAVFSKAPPTATQTQNVRAFEKLNRLAGAIAKAGWPYLNLSDKHMLRHNAVARWLKPAISDHAFDPRKIAQVIHPGDDLAYVTWTYNRSSQIHLIGIKLALQNTPKPGSKIFLVVFDGSAKVAYADCRELVDVNLSITLPYPDYTVYSLLIFTSSPQKKGYDIKNFIYKEAPGMKYSLKEQLTGDVWLDGRPIYVRSWNVTVYLTNPGIYYTDLMDIHGQSTVVNADIYVTSSSFAANLHVHGNNANIMATGATPTLSQPFVSCNVVTNPNNNKMQLRVSSTVANGGFNGDITVRYTKYSDTPILDG